MPALCHRCQRELPGFGSARGEPESRDNVLLFCPHCAAPQIRLPEYSRTAAPPSGVASTGAAPPPHPGLADGLPPGAHGGLASAPAHVNWRAALPIAGAVAAATAVTDLLSLLGETNPVGIFAAFAGQLLLLGGSVLVIGLYAARSPRSHLSLSRGWSIGLVTGLLIAATHGLTLGAAGVVARFVLHNTQIDTDLAAALASSQQATHALFQGQPNAEATQQYMAEHLRIPEFRAGLALAGIAFQNAVVVLISAAGGAAAGLLRAPRLRRPRS